MSTADVTDSEGADPARYERVLAGTICEVVKAS